MRIRHRTLRAVLGCLFLGLHRWEFKVVLHPGRRDGDLFSGKGYAVTFDKCAHCDKERHLSVRETRLSDS